VGVGTTSPYTKAHISGTLTVSESTNVQYLTIIATTSNNSIYSNYTGLGTDKPVIIGTFANRTNQLYLDTTSNIGIGQTSFGTSATKTLAVSSGTAPSTSPADAFQMYSADITAGNAAAHFRTEGGAVIKLYQQTTGVAAATFVQGSTNAVYEDSTFGGYTLKQVVKALQNAGFLS
jgi:hypothetical protein